MDFCVYLRKIFFVPEDLCSRIRGLKRISCYLKNLLLSNLLIQSVTNRLCSRIHPDWCIGQHIPLSVNWNCRPALTINPDSRDLICSDICLLHGFLCCPADCIPPFLRILLCPSLMWIIYRIVTTGCCKNFSIPVKYRNLAGTCSDINPQ